MNSEKGAVIFLSVPESLRGKIETGKEAEEHIQGHDLTDFSLDPDIPLPVELEAGKTALDPEGLSWEMILSWILRILSVHGRGYAVRHEWLDYYRGLVLVLKPNIFNEFTEAAILKAKNGDFALSLEILSALEGLFPGEPVLPLNRALVLEEEAGSLEKNGNESAAEERFTEALKAYEKTLEMEPVFPNALFNAGFFFMRRGNFSRALECFSGYIDMDTAEDEKREKAEELIKEISGRGLSDDDLREAYECIRRGKEEEGMGRIRRFLEQRPLVWNGWFILGWALRKLGRFEDGRAALQKALELGGGNSDTRNELSICLMEMKDYRAARKELETALREEPENIKIISNLGVLALKEGKKHEAGAFFRTVLELNPEDIIARTSLENIGL